MDAFFASVEQRDDTALRGKPVLVGGDGLRGVVTAASYEARVFGCRSAQPMAVAKRMCPHAVVVKGRHSRYSEISNLVFEIFDRYTPLVQPLSIDEAFLDVTAAARHTGPAERIAAEIRSAIVEETGGLTASVGVAPNKFLAKLASDLDKPDGLTVIRREDVDRVLPPLPVGSIWGVGPRTVERLASFGVRTIGDLRAMPPEFFDRRLGSVGRRVRELCFGLDDRPVRPDRRAKSVGQERTFGVDLTDPEAVRRVILTESERVAARLRRAGVAARSVTVKIRFGDFQTITRRQTLTAPTDGTADNWNAARDLFDGWCRREGFRPVRLIGVTAADLSQPAAPDLFPDPDRVRGASIDSAVDAIRTRFGDAAIGRGVGRAGRDKSTEAGTMSPPHP